MWWLIAAGIFAYAILSSEEREARERWDHKREQVERSVDDHRRKIELHLHEIRQSYDFKLLTSMHHSSLIVADTAYKLLHDARTSLGAIGKMIMATKEKRYELETNFKQSIKDQANREKVKEELKVVSELRKSLFADKDKVKEQRDHLYSEVKRLNAQTAELKCLIRDRCGDKGVSWFSRLEERKRLRKMTEGGHNCSLCQR